MKPFRNLRQRQSSKHVECASPRRTRITAFFVMHHNGNIPIAVAARISPRARPEQYDLKHGHGGRRPSPLGERHQTLGCAWSNSTGKVVLHGQTVWPCRIRCKINVHGQRAKSTCATRPVASLFQCILEVDQREGVGVAVARAHIAGKIAEQIQLGRPTVRQSDGIIGIQESGAHMRSGLQKWQQLLAVFLNRRTKTEILPVRSGYPKGSSYRVHWMFYSHPIGHGQQGREDSNRYNAPAPPLQQSSLPVSGPAARASRLTSLPPIHNTPAHGECPRPVLHRD